MSEPRFLPRERLTQLFDALAAGHRVIGPRVRDGAIVFESLDGPEALPAGVRDDQAPGRYRLHRDGSQRCFDHAAGPQALKRLLFVGRELLWTAERTARGFSVQRAEPPVERPLAAIGVRPCDLAALALHDAHFLDGPHPDAAYAARRRGLFLVAVNCARPAPTCFCASTGDGPNAMRGFDLLMDELDDGYVLRAGSDDGARVLAILHTLPVTLAQAAVVEEQRTVAVHAQTRALPGHDLNATLFARLDHAHYAQVAERCLSCGNCTAVCPTCFCHSHVEQPDLDGKVTHHYRQWDSCFTEGHSTIHGIVIRADTAKRYRQWMTHKLGSWHEQYGRSGCVGCGRCITWCPAGIDITEEAKAIAGGKA